MASRAARTTAKAWFSDPATYPIIGILGFAGAMAVVGGVRFLSVSPDVLISREKRLQLNLRSEQEGNAFRTHRIAAANLQSNAITKEPEYQAFKARNS
ncbi:hypothetical protein H310_03304 [Aphanomyces invadans]|uniref:Uncharacterized protein n=1 Tax=Aphanomyces invadans TaxID=157072 RepID=A0A024UGY5_9STRA|nr:hypothetical protein H310_03304 [Aphanomyces invadans]ETW05554.1 hypothetical protein H310_03304 [Aphanomyces invadans]|eukprot:XP_008865331.1 hypothetical protein H310_03304 [Aphanomyces invadans]